MNRILTVLCVLGAALLWPSDSVAGWEFNGGFDVGVLSAGPGKGGMTLGFSGAASSRRTEWFLVTGRASVAVLGFVGHADPGFDLHLGGAATISGESLWGELGLGVDGISYRACGALNCGRISGVAPSASARLVWWGPYLSRSLGISATAGAHWVIESNVAEGINWTFAAGPIWRFGGETRRL